LGGSWEGKKAGEVQERGDLSEKKKKTAGGKLRGGGPFQRDRCLLGGAERAGRPTAAERTKERRGRDW